ncbi:hypothetical protein IOC44_18755 [Vibrio vulnificus]|uniref:hypothetical protein n=1 Tax=Vibrio vulnificus TaxID=672 RepID=UPI001E58E608|nr:hypothetical protein [Vibrio vulnificus]EJB5268839.1 hypothetical protein [Vibrio vulnificus]MCD1411552.1 hypothetical protein [Vibrio vulnificus]MCD1420617.1 hypothetical protein [Vibrio vulnificus]MCD1425135.1 hypothetical protein [Vibrio vulnificus]MCD1440141.1 hypothetical protein [Vibrio vulnificus]
MLGKALKTTLLGVCTLLPITASANNFNYNMFEVRMGSSPGTFGAEFNTYFTENTHFIGRFDSEFSGDWDLAGGIGFNGPMGQFADIYGQMLIHNIKNKSSDKIGDEWKTEVNIGARVWLMQNVEIHGRLGQLISNDSSNSIVGIGARFHSTQQLSIGADLRNNGTYGHQILMSVNFMF